jgi:3-deoxy-manno-octulosonate cytidylyltransferase (CMP-KDO synthetase)
MLQHVYERASPVPLPVEHDHCHRRPAGLCGRKKFRSARGDDPPDHLSGTDRVAEVASAENAEIVVNIQGDEPLIDPAAIDAAILPLVHDPDVVMATLKKRIEDPREITDPNVVKVVTNPSRRRDLFFALPHSLSCARQGPGGAAAPYFKHIGLYVYRRDFCSGIRLPVGPLERPSGWSNCGLENGFRIRVVETEYESLGVDTPEDLERVSRLVEAATCHRMAKYIFWVKVPESNG